MPKLPKGFGRRKSTANALEEIQTSPVGQTSFRVFERPDAGSKPYDGGLKLAKNTPKARDTQRYNEDNIFEDLKGSRGSGASNSNTASTTDNSSRLSAASTTPSSTDLPNQTEWRSPHDKPFSDIPVPPVPRTTSGFSLKAAGHTFSFGRGKSTPSPTKALDEPPPVPRKDSEDENPNRPRAFTTSSYASTATPPKLEQNDLGLSLGGNFADMFSGFGKRKSAILEVEDLPVKSENADLSTTPAIPARSYAGTRMNQPSPLQIDRSKNISPSPNSWTSQHSHDGLMANSSPQFVPPVPRHSTMPLSNGGASSTPSSKLQRPAASADIGLKRNPAVARRQSTADDVENPDESAKLLKEAVSATRYLTADPAEARVRDSWLVPLSTSPGPLNGSSTPTRRSEPSESSSRTPKANPGPEDDSIFDQQITAAASLANQYEQRPSSPPRERTPPKNKVMTPAQFEKYKKDQELFKSIGGHSKDDDNEEDNYEDDEDEAEKQRQIAKQRRKQEAHMAVYRQTMMKVTGETSSPGAPSRPSMQRPRSSLGVSRFGPEVADDEEEDEEIPLAILAAHGFPNKNRPPAQLSTRNSNPNLRASTMMGAQTGPLPVFARKLPDDPYFGAGLVNPMNRESLALGGGSGSVYGGSNRGGVPAGGLVGVIATEERARAMRRGSPNTAGEYGPPLPNGLNGMGMPPMMPPMGRSMTMPNGFGPMGPMLSPGDAAQLQMAQQMQEFMQMQMQFMQLMTSNQGGPPSQNGPLPPMPALPPMGNMGQVPLQGLRPGSANGRIMSVVDPNAAPWQQQSFQRNTMYAPSIQAGGFAPSIAPSERSNVGLPGRYRPVSHHPAAENKSRTNTMSGALENWTDAKQGSSTVKVVKKSGHVSDEDDEEGWEAMKQKREKKKSTWKLKRDDGGGIKDLWGFANN